MGMIGFGVWRMKSLPKKHSLEELINLINSNDSKVSAVSAIRKNRDESINIGEVYKFDS